MNKKTATQRCEVPTGRSHFAELQDAIADATLVFSNHATPGDGGHNTYFYGSPVAEQAAAFRVRNNVLKWLHAQPATPRTRDEFKALLTVLIAEIEKIAFHDQAIYVINGVDYSDSGWAAHFRAPTVLSVEAMKGQLLTIVLRRLRDLSLPEDTF